jgi:two-component system, cell cycle sensor histidine kinase DivJ
MLDGPMTPDRARLTPPPARTIASAGAAVVAVLLGVWSGGLGGPAAALCLLPLALSLGGGVPAAAPGAGLSLAAAAVLALAGASGWIGAEPEGPLDLWLSVAALLAVAGAGVSGLATWARDLGDRAERAEAERRRLEQLLRDQPGLILLADGAGRVFGAYGELPPELSGERLFREGLAAAARADDRPALRAALAQAVLRGDAAVDFRPPGAALALAARFRRTDTGRLIVSLHDPADVSERLRAAESERDRALAASAAKSRFLAGMSHELRTPLNAVLGFADVMRQQVFGPLPGRYADYPERIHEAGRHLLDLINDVLDVSKIEADKYQLRPELHDAREPVRAALAILRVQADEADVRLRTDLPSEPLMVEADRRALKQIVFNLAGNALKFTPKGGLVTVSLGEADGELELTVADTGVGIAPEDLDRLGRPFEQVGDTARQAMGTGLGLSLVKALAGLHGGVLTIESALGEGAAFTVRLPVLQIRPSSPGALPDNVIPFTAQR